MNGLIHLEKTQLDMTPVAKLDKGIVNFGQLNGLIAAPILGISYAVQRWLNPCQSTTFAWKILVECSNERQLESKWMLKSLVYLTGISIFSLWVAIHLIGAFVFQATEFLLVPCYCLVSYIKNLRIALENCEKYNIHRVLGRYRQLQILERFFNCINQDTGILSIWIAVHLIGTFSFQCAEVFYLPSYCIVSYLKIFRNALNNCEARKLEQGLRKYRQLQILERFLNRIHQDVITGAMLNMLIVSIIISAYSLIHLGSKISVPHLILFSCLLVDCIATIVLGFGAFALVHTESTITLEFLKNLLIPRLELKYLCCIGIGKFDLKKIKKFVGSLYPLKVQIGNTNFVEKTTPITVLEFCIGQTVNLLLMK
ncbi:unnamed protein product [Orchesella dallaii]|uniref:Gustatory receptor n=1 Tax=Orchesella dallaii TaxID=48710 RepID=A0ABP1RQA7_9HEXA